MTARQAMVLAAALLVGAAAMPGTQIPTMCDRIGCHAQALRADQPCAVRPAGEQIGASGATEAPVRPNGRKEP